MSGPSTQDHIANVGFDVFGVDAMNSQPERLLRFLEEAIELVRAGGLSRDDVDRIVAYEFTRPIETDIRKEFGGAGCTLYAAANAFGESLDRCIKAEVERVEANKDKIREKSRAKPDSVHAVRGV